LEWRLQDGSEKSHLILVDTSVWVDFFSSSRSRAGVELRRMIADAEPFAISGVIVSEILQGLRRHVDQIERYLSQWEMLEPLGFSTYREAAAISDLVARKDSHSPPSTP
jgi:predicted nucleic acid-binding protein